MFPIYVICLFYIIVGCFHLRHLSYTQVSDGMVPRRSTASDGKLQSSVDDEEGGDADDSHVDALASSIAPTSLSEPGGAAAPGAAVESAGNPRDGPSALDSASGDTVSARAGSSSKLDLTGSEAAALSSGRSSDTGIGSSTAPSVPRHRMMLQQASAAVLAGAGTTADKAARPAEPPPYSIDYSPSGVFLLLISSQTSQAHVELLKARSLAITQVCSMRSGLLYTLLVMVY